MLTARSDAKGAEAVATDQGGVSRGLVEHRLLDLADLDSVRSFASAFARDGDLDVLVNNAGVMSPPRVLTPKASSPSSPPTTSATSPSTGLLFATSSAKSRTPGSSR